MTLKKIVEYLNARIYSNGIDLDLDITSGCGCDLMSDVLSFIKPGSILLTGLNNIQTIRTAEIAEIRAVCLVRGKEPTEEMKKMADKGGIALIGCDLTLFEACGILFQKGLRG